MRTEKYFVKALCICTENQAELDVSFCLNQSTLVPFGLGYGEIGKSVPWPRCICTVQLELLYMSLVHVRYFIHKIRISKTLVDGLDWPITQLYGIR